jgi:hypothetical protein
MFQFCLIETKNYSENQYHTLSKEEK